MKAAADSISRVSEGGPLRALRGLDRTAAQIACPHCGRTIVPTPEELRQWREAADLTQIQLAARLEISRALISHLENGKRLPSAAVFARYRKLMPQ